MKHLNLCITLLTHKMDIHLRSDQVHPLDSPGLA